MPWFQRLVPMVHACVPRISRRQASGNYSAYVGKSSMPHLHVTFACPCSLPPQATLLCVCSSTATPWAAWSQAWRWPPRPAQTTTAATAAAAQQVRRVRRGGTAWNVFAAQGEDE